jgi:hypothetical protein
MQGLFAGKGLCVQEEPLGGPADPQDFRECPAVNVLAGRKVTATPPWRAEYRLFRLDHQVASVCLSRNRRWGATFCSCQHREIIMRSIVLALVIFLTETSLSFAQGHMGTPQEQQACRRDAQRFCRQQLGDDGAVQQCLQQNRTRLSKRCQKVFASHGM